MEKKQVVLKKKGGEKIWVFSMDAQEVEDRCEKCGEEYVYGVEELIMMGYVTITSEGE